MGEVGRWGMYRKKNFLLIYYQGENKLHFNEMMMMMSALYLTNKLSWSFTVLAH